jgi:hypothetical protein
MSVNSQTVVFHLAYHKTASKWIWANFFAQHYPTLQTNVVTKPITELHDHVAAAQSCSPFIIRQRVEEGSMGGELANLADAMAAAYPNAKIVVGIRSQRSILASHYGQYVKNGGRLGFKKYLAETTRVKWHYYSTIKSLMDRFGDQVIVYLFEEFRRDRYAVLCALRDFVGVPSDGLADGKLRDLAGLPSVNPRRNDLMIDTMLTLNRLRMRHEKNAIIPQISRPGHDHIAVEVADVIGRTYSKVVGEALRYRSFDDEGVLEDSYGAGNAALAKLINRPLHKLGYPI